MGFFNSGQVLAFSYIITLVKKDSAGLASAVLNFFIMSTGFVVQPLIIYISPCSQVEFFNEPVIHTYQNMFILIVWSLLIAALSIAFVDEEKQEK